MGRPAQRHQVQHRALRCNYVAHCRSTPLAHRSLQVVWPTLWVGSTQRRSKHLSTFPHFQFESDYSLGAKAQRSFQPDQLGGRCQRDTEGAMEPHIWLERRQACQLRQVGAPGCALPRLQVGGPPLASDAAQPRPSQGGTTLLSTRPASWSSTCRCEGDSASGRFSRVVGCNAALMHSNQGPAEQHWLQLLL